MNEDIHGPFTGLVLAYNLRIKRRRLDVRELIKDAEKLANEDR